MILSILQVFVAFATLQRGQRPLRVEPFGDEVAVQPRKLTVAGDARAAAAAGERAPLRSSASSSSPANDLVDGSAGDRLVDAGPLDLHPDAPSSPSADRRLSPRNRLSDARIVDRAFRSQASDRLVDQIRRMASGQPLTNLRLGQLAAGEELESVDVGRVSRQTS